MSDIFNFRPRSKAGDASPSSPKAPRMHPTTKEQSNADPRAVRIQKFLADQGICSRRAAEEMIAHGEVLVNGIPAELGQKIVPGRDRLNVQGRHVHARTTEKVSLLMNKPRGVICSNEDPHNDRIVFDLLPAPWNKMRLFCVGRLDKDSEGLLILTNDGDLAHRLTHPSSGIVKRYHVEVSKPFNHEHIRVLQTGVSVDGERLQADKVIPAQRKFSGADRQLEIHLHHGRKREIRRMLEHLGYFVERLQRYQIGKLVLRGLGPGHVRLLTARDLKLVFDQAAPAARGRGKGGGAAAPEGIEFED